MRSMRFSDNQNYDAMIKLVEDLSRVPDCNIIQGQAVRFLYAFALNRYDTFLTLTLLKLLKLGTSPSLTLSTHLLSQSDTPVHSRYPFRQPRTPPPTPPFYCHRAVQCKLFCARPRCDVLRAAARPSE